MTAGHEGRATPAGQDGPALKVGAIAVTNLRRLVRDRSSLVVYFLVPILLIVVLGSVFGSAEPRLGLVLEDDGPLAAELAAELESLEGVDLRPVEHGEGVSDLRRGELDGLVVIPAGYEAALSDSALGRAGPAEVRFTAPPGAGTTLRGLIQSTVARQGARVRAAQAAAELGPAGPEEAYAAAGQAQQAAGSTVTVTEADGASYESRASGIDRSAAQQLVLFVFLTGVTAATALIQTRALGVSRRMVATPTPIWAIVAGEAGGRWLITLVQALFITVGTAVLFGAHWGSPPGAALVILAFTLVAAGAAVLVGAAFRTVSQAEGVVIALSLGLAALGGSMVPLEVFPAAVRTVAFATPHAWANDALDRLVQRDAGVGDVLGHTAVLLGYAAVLFAIASAMLRRALTR